MQKLLFSGLLGEEARARAEATPNVYPSKVHDPKLKVLLTKYMENSVIIRSK